jgi:hypothetical protein
LLLKDALARREEKEAFRRAAKAGKTDKAGKILNFFRKALDLPPCGRCTVRA